MKKIFFIFALFFFVIKPLYSQSPYPPTPLFPSEGSINVSITPEITWSSGGPYATTYVIGCGSWGITTNSPGSAIIPWEYHLQPSTQYILTGTTWNNNSGQSAFGVSHFTTGPVANLSRPSNGETEIRLDAIMRWGSIATPECVQISTDPNFTNIILSDSSAGGELYVVPNGKLKDSSLYYWRVADRLDGNWLPSLSSSFTTVKNPPGSPYLVYPQSGNTISLTQLFDWDIGFIIYSTSKLWFMISEDINFSTLVYSDSSIIPPVPNMYSISVWIDYRIPEGILQNNKLYYYRLCPGNGVGWGGLTDIYTAYTCNPILPLGLLYPANGSTNISLTPTLDWEDAEYFDNYWIEISKNTDDLSIILIDSTLTSSQFTIPSGLLLNNTTYYWKVKAKNARGWGELSQNFNFTTIPDVPVSPILLSPVNGAINVPIKTFLDWNDVPLATSYNLQVSTDSSFTNIVIDDSTLTLSQDTLAPGLLSNNTVYYWRVRGKNQNGWGNYSLTNYFTTVLPVPPAPILAIPKVLIFTLTPLMDWGPPSGPGLIYRIQISTDENFTSIVLDSANIQTSFMDVPPGVLYNETIYYWRVNATNAGGTSPWSLVSYFNVLIFTPILFSPPNGATDISLTPNILWNYEVSATLYRLQISTDSIFGTPTLDSVLTTPWATITVPQGVLTPHQKYYWRVNMLFFGQTGPWSEIWNFTTGSNIPNSPALFSPVNGAVNQPVNLSFIWRKAIEPIADKKKSAQKNSKQKNLSDNSKILSNYCLEYSTDSTFMTNVFIDSSITDTTKAITGLNNSTNYFWRVKAKNESGWGNYSQVNYFTTVPSVPEAPIINFPLNGMVYTLTPLLNWEPSPPELIFRIQISADDIFSSIILDSANIQTAFMEVPPGILFDGANYSWRINATNAGGTSPWSYVGNFRPFILYPPILLSPSNGAVDVSLTPDILWDVGLLYIPSRLIISTDSLFRTMTLDTTITTETPAVTIPQAILIPHQKYYWRVHTTFWGHTETWSDIWNFTTGSDIPNSPALFSPMNGAINQPIDLTFLWRKAIEPIAYKKKPAQKNIKRKNISDNSKILSNYWFEYTTDSTFTTGIVIDSSVTDTIKTINGLNNLTKYFWRVKAMNESGWGNFSPVWNFKTIVSIPIVTDLLSPINGSTDISLVTLLDWNEVNNAESYRVQVSKDSLFVNLAFDSTGIYVSNIFVPSGKLSTLTKYFWRVRAINVGGEGPYSTIWNFTTIPDFPGSPLLYQPDNNAVNQQTTVTLKWFKALETLDIKESFKKVPERKNKNSDLFTLNKYWVEYSIDSTFATGVVRDSSISDTIKVISGLNYFTKYFWRVKAKNQTGWGSFSSIWNFTTVIPVPSAPIPISPANDTTSVSLIPIFDWSDVEFASSYRIQVSTDSLFITSQFDTSGITISQITIPNGILTGLTRYFWRINSTNFSGSSPWSTVWNFRTLQILTLKLKVYLEGFWNGSIQIPDSAMIYLANPVSPFAYVDTAKVIITSTGTVSLNFSKVPNGNYYIVINHRNHFETWSATHQLFFTNSVVNYDFTTSATQAYGSNMKQIGSIWVLFGGDPNRDGFIDAFDVPILLGQFGMLGYLNADFNGDESVDASDIPIFLANFGLIKRTPLGESQLPAILINKKLDRENFIEKLYKKKNVPNTK